MKKYKATTVKMSKLELLGRLALAGDEEAQHQIKSMHTISQGHMDNLKADNGKIRLWVSRMTREDGAPEDNEIFVEKLIKGTWEKIPDSTESQ